MADRHIGALNAAADIYDDSLLVAEQQGEAVKVTGRQWKGYAQAAVQKYVGEAQKAADKALEAVGKAENAVQKAEASADAAVASAKRAEQYSGKPPVIQDGRWWIWDAAAQVYRDTGEAVRGNVMYAAFFVNPSDGGLYMVADKEYGGPGFQLVNGELEVVLQYGS